MGTIKRDESTWRETWQGAKDALRPVTTPEGERNGWKVERFEIRRDDFGMFLHNLKQPGRAVVPGRYTRLVRGMTTWMSDTPAELRDHMEPVIQATGKCLITGLGLGVVAEALLRKPSVELIRIVEIDPDVCALVGPHLKKLGGDRIVIVTADALTYKPQKNERYDMIWHDIWHDICEDNLEQMTLLSRRWSRRATWQGFWNRELCREQRRQTRATSSHFGMGW